MQFIRFTVAENDQIISGIMADGLIKEIEGNPLASWQYTEQEYKLEDVQLQAPIVPRHIIGIGKNYLAADEERPEQLPDIPVFFYKPTTSVIGTDENIILPSNVNEVKFESELAVVIGKEAKDIAEEEVAD